MSHAIKMNTTNDHEPDVFLSLSAIRSTHGGYRTYNANILN